MLHMAPPAGSGCTMCRGRNALAAIHHVRGVNERLQKKRVVALPDLFLDVLVPMPSWEAAQAGLDAVAARAGGTFPVEAPEFRLGGNAMNFAGAMCELGAETALLAETDQIGHALLSRRHPRLDQRCVRLGEAAITVALECPDANILLQHGGPVADATLDDFGADGRRLLGATDAVAVVNWAATRHGSQMLTDVREAAPDALLYLDTSDLSHRAEELPRLLQAAQDAEVDVWAMNEHEAHVLGDGGAPHRVGAWLHEEIGARIDLHTREAATSFGDDVVSVKANPAPGTKATGAGDHWNAGNVAGDLLGLTPQERLQLAHDTATAYVTGMPLHAVQTLVHQPA